MRHRVHIRVAELVAPCVLCAAASLPVACSGPVEPNRDCDVGTSELSDGFWGTALACPREDACPAVIAALSPGNYRDALVDLVDSLRADAESWIDQGCFADCLAEHPGAAECREAVCTTSQGAVVSYSLLDTYDGSEHEPHEDVTTLEIDITLPEGVDTWTEVVLTHVSTLTVHPDGTDALVIDWELGWTGSIAEDLPDSGSMSGHLYFVNSDYCGVDEATFTTGGCVIEATSHDDTCMDDCTYETVSIDGTEFVFRYTLTDELCAPPTRAYVDGECIGELDSEYRVVGPC
jgi:hypothetical protein